MTEQVEGLHIRLNTGGADFQNPYIEIVSETRVVAMIPTTLVFDGSYKVTCEVESWKLARKLAAAPDMYDEMNRASLQPARAQELMRQNGLKIDDLDDPMQKLAFTFYSMLVEAAHRAETIIESVQGEQP
jgi:hypothetical protein